MDGDDLVADPRPGVPRSMGVVFVELDRAAVGRGLGGAGPGEGGSDNDCGQKGGRPVGGDYTASMNADSEAPPPFYEWAGGSDAIRRLIDAFYNRVEHDELIGVLFPGGVSAAE